MKKYIIVFAVILATIVGIGAVQYFNRPDGSTLESREEICSEFPRGKDWKISIEQAFSDYIISGIYSRDGMSGIAVFEPYGNGKYKLQSREWRVYQSQGSVLIFSFRQAIDKFPHSRKQTSIVGGSCQNQLGKSKSLCHNLCHIASCQIIESYPFLAFLFKPIP